MLWAFSVTKVHVSFLEVSVRSMRPVATEQPVSFSAFWLLQPPCYPAPGVTLALQLPRREWGQYQVKVTCHWWTCPYLSSKGLCCMLPSRSRSHSHTASCDVTPSPWRSSSEKGPRLQGTWGKRKGKKKERKKRRKSVVFQLDQFSNLLNCATTWALVVTWAKGGKL